MRLHSDGGTFLQRQLKFPNEQISASCSILSAVPDVSPPIPDVWIISLIIGHILTRNKMFHNAIDGALFHALYMYIATRSKTRLLYVVIGKTILVVNKM